MSIAGQMKYINKLQGEAKRYIPVVQVSFHTEDQCYQLRGVAKGMDALPDPTDQLLSVTTNKSLDAPAGTFSINLAGAGWFMPEGKQILKANDLVIIYMGYKAEKDSVTWVDNTTHTASEDLSTVMIGLIDTVTLNENGGGNGIQPQVTTTVTGRDFGKILIKAMLRFYPQIGWDTSKEQKFFLTQEGWITLFKAFTGEDAIIGSPAKILDTTMRAILRKLMNIKWKVYDDNLEGGNSGSRVASLGNILRYRFAKTNFFIPFFMSAQQYEGSVWNLMERVNIKPFTELFVDTRDRWEVANAVGIPQLVNEPCEEESDYAKGQLDDTKGKWEYPAAMFGKKDGAQAVVVYRNTPFDKESWNKLRAHNISPVDIVSQTLSYSDNENFNLFWAGTTLTPFNAFDLKRVKPPLLSEDNASRYGLSPLEVTVEGLELTKEQESSQVIGLANLTNELNAKLKAWFENNVNYLSGTMTLRGKGDLKVGQRLIHEAMGREFYIESVVQSFQVYGDWHTTATVTRGMIPPLPEYRNYVQVITPPEEAVPATQQAVPEAKYYTVKANDTLWGIAASELGNGEQWTALWDLNKDMLIARDSRNSRDAGRWIYSGQILKLP